MPAIEADYVSQAKKTMESLRTTDREGRPKFELTTSQLRNLLSLTSEIFDDAESVTGDTIPQGLLDKVQYLRVRFIYQAGREAPVREFLQKARLLEALEEVKTSREKLIGFCRYMEALVAYKKYLAPNDER